jgi:hypothetical protein
MSHPSFFFHDPLGAHASPAEVLEAFERALATATYPVEDEIVHWVVRTVTAVFDQVQPAYDRRRIAEALHCIADHLQAEALAPPAHGGP